MRTITYRLSDLQKAVIPIGFVGENEFTRVVIDSAEIYSDYPNAAAGMVVLPPNGDPYPAVVTRDGNNVVWDVTASDVVYDGSGEIQLSFTDDEMIGKSYKARIVIRDSIMPSGEAPEALDDFLARASEALTAIPETIDEALAEAKASGEFDGEDGFSPTVDVTEITDGHRVTITDKEGAETFDVMNGSKGEPGEPGTPGHSPVLTATKSGKVTTVYSDGVQIAQINDGEDGSSGDIIDDNAGAGDTNKVWSADKTDTKLSALLNDLNGLEDDISAKYTKPVGGIPATDIADGVIPDISQVESDLESFMDGWGEGEEIHKNILDLETPTSTTQYYDVSNSGALRLNNPTGTTTYVSYIIKTKANQLYTCNVFMRYVIPLNGSKTPVVTRSDMIQTVKSFDTTNYPTMEYVAVSIRYDNVTGGMGAILLSEGDTPSGEIIPGGQALPGWCAEAIEDVEEEIQNLDIKPRKNRIYMLTDTSFSEEKKFTEFATSVKAKCMHLVVNLTSFTSVTVGLRSDTRPVFYAQVTDSTVYLYDYNGGLTEHTQTYTHGLTIADNLSIDLYAKANTGLYYVTVGTNGTEYTTPSSFSVAPTGLIYPYASMEGSASFVQFSAECNTQRPIWMFGDSYLGTNNTARWAYYLVNREKDNRVMMDAFAGENSTSAYASLEALINSGVPDYIVWCLGMNDGGDTGTTPNATWLAKVNSVIELCEANNVIPVLATVPTVSSVNNEGKNTWVRASGHQYIDFAKAVGASDQGVWFTGMLSQDNVHPSITGAITLYHAALAGCPQLNQT